METSDERLLSRHKERFLQTVPCTRKKIVGNSLLISEPRAATSPDSSENDKTMPEAISLELQKTNWPKGWNAKLSLAVFAKKTRKSYPLSAAVEK
jgi:hypothetical protein